MAVAKVLEPLTTRPKVPRRIREMEEAAKKKEAQQAALLQQQQKERFQRTKPRTLFDTVLGIDKSIEKQTTLGT
jgi:hypothetical protein